MVVVFTIIVVVFTIIVVFFTIIVVLTIIVVVTVIARGACGEKYVSNVYIVHFCGNIEHFGEKLSFLWKISTFLRKKYNLGGEKIQQRIRLVEKKAKY